KSTTPSRPRRTADDPPPAVDPGGPRPGRAPPRAGRRRGPGRRRRREGPLRGPGRDRPGPRGRDPPPRGPRRGRRPGPDREGPRAGHPIGGVAGEARAHARRAPGSPELEPPRGAPEGKTG